MKTNISYNFYILMPLTLKITLASISPIEYSSHTWDKIITIVATLGTLP